jgi:hypothetical protein
MNSKRNTAHAAEAKRPSVGRRRFLTGAAAAVTAPLFLPRDEREIHHPVRASRA